MLLGLLVMLQYIENIHTSNRIYRIGRLDRHIDFCRYYRHAEYLFFRVYVIFLVSTMPRGVRSINLLITGI